MKIEFVAEPHGYLIDGEPAPGITEILRAAGISAAMDSGLEDVLDAEQAELARARGALVHRGIEYDVQGDPFIEGDLDPKVAAMIRAARLARQELALDADERIPEVLVAHPAYRYCTKIDLTARRNGQPIIVNWKPPTRWPHYGIQMAGEAMAWEAHFGWKGRPVARYGIHLDATTKKGYRIEVYEDRSDFRVWSAALEIYGWKRRSGQR